MWPGNIGVGKTSLAERLGARLGWVTGFESVVDNPYLADFYTDMRQWSFHLQVFFLGHRAQQHLALAEGSRSAIGDRSIYEDAHIFARVLRHMGNISERDYESYRNVYDLIAVQSAATRSLDLPDGSGPCAASSAFAVALDRLKRAYLPTISALLDTFLR